MLETCDESTGVAPKRAKTDAAFERVWLAYKPRIMRLVARLSGDSDANDDLVQEVGVRAFEGFRGFRNESAAYTWLYRIAVNVVLRWREKRRHDTIPLDSPEASQVRSEGAGPEQRAMQSSLRPAVWAAMATLPEEQRTTLILQVYEGLRYREIGEVLEIPIGTVKSRLNIAMRRMKKELQDYAL